MGRGFGSRRGVLVQGKERMTRDYDLFIKDMPGAIEAIEKFVGTMNQVHRVE